MNSSTNLNIVTNVAHAGFKDHQFCGHSVFAELLGNETLASLLALSITGNRITPTEAKIIDDIAVTSAMADPRIWPLKITSIVASYGDKIISSMAGSLCAEKAIIGPGTVSGSAELLCRLRSMVGDENLNNKKILEEKVAELIRTEKRLPGFGVAFRPVDERLENLIECARRRERDHLPYWQLMTKMCESVYQMKGVRPNFSSGIAAVLLDLGFTPAQTATMSVAFVQFCFFANAVDGVKRDAEVMRCLPADRVKYVGMKPRKSPRENGLNT